MASLGLPGLAGFWGEFPAILSAYSPGFGLSEPLFRTLMVIAAVGTVFAAGYLLWLYQRTAFGTVPTEWTHGRARRRTPSAPPSTTTHATPWRGHPRRHRHRVDRLDADARR